MTPQPIDYDYFEWLISQIAVPRNKTYNDLFDIMHGIEFVWMVPNDDNRVQDGLDLRSEFLDGRRARLNLGGASVLEVIIGLSRRCAFHAGETPNKWAWYLIRNLRLHRMLDPLDEEKVLEVQAILEDLIWRTYDKSGKGGFFPMKRAKEDQTKVEVWYQMNAYITEMQAV